MPVFQIINFNRSHSPKPLLNLLRQVFRTIILTGSNYQITTIFENISISVYKCLKLFRWFVGVKCYRNYRKSNSWIKYDYVHTSVVLVLIILYFYFIPINENLGIITTIVSGWFDFYYGYLCWIISTIFDFHLFKLLNSFIFIVFKIPSQLFLHFLHHLFIII